jgi:hypothetical protein
LTTHADTLPGRGPAAFSVFLNALKKNYSWLAAELEGGDRYEYNTMEKLQETNS